MNGFWVSSGQVTRFFGLSAVFGLFAGALFDLFRIMRIARRSSDSPSFPRFLRFGDRLLCFISDILYWLLLAVAYSIFIYRAFYGRFRIGSLLCVAGGFLVWHYTAGRLVVYLADRMIALIRIAVGFILSITLKPVFRALRFLVRLLSGFLGGAFAAVHHRIAVRRELSLAAKGFGIQKLKRRKN
ncbi:MAG: hypothetical protein IJD17_00050 [Clostridia bacterium]|nr:hypothetical protein [Clostridia bacterium]